MVKTPTSWKFIKAIEAARDVDAIASVLVGIAQKFGFTSVFGGLVPDRRSLAARQSAEALMLVQHFPTEWAKRYNDRHYLLHDPIVHRLGADLNPFVWKEAYASCPVDSDTKLVGGGAAEFGLRDGYVVPVNTLDYRLAAVSFGGGAVDLSPDEAAALAFAANLAVGRFLKLRSLTNVKAGSLTPRESDCLIWAGEGKTDWEISQILGISRSTVTKHIAATRSKLGAVNKAHAIALAIRQRLLE